MRKGVDSLNVVAFSICRYDEERYYINDRYTVSGILTEYHQAQNKYAELMRLKGNKAIDAGRFGELMQSTDTIVCEINMDSQEIRVTRHEELMMSCKDVDLQDMDKIMNKLIACKCT